METSLFFSFSFSYLFFSSQLLGLEVDKIESLLVPLLLEGKIVGKIDQVRGLLDTSQSVGVGKYSAIERWSNALVRLRSSLPMPAGNNR